MIEQENLNKIYFIGIGGIGMSAAAGLAKASDFQVSGSDSKALYSPAKDVLSKYDIPYFQGYEAEHISPETADLFVISSGENLANPEVKVVYEMKLPHCGLAEFLQILAAGSLRVVVAGTHGKSTTSGLLGHLLKHLDDSSFFVGGVLTNYEENFYLGSGHYFVFEGDEYKEEFDDPTPKFQFLKPDILILTNLEFDHPDVFENFDSMLDEFRQLISLLPEDGLLVYNADNVHLAKLAHETEVSAVSFGIDNEADFKVENIAYGEYTKFDVRNKFSHSLPDRLTDALEQYQTQLPGKINVYNAMACVATLRALGFSRESLALDLLTFQGLKRRFEIVSKKGGIVVIDDYAHHPTAVRETLAAARLKYPKAKIWAVFEPHTFSRTQATLPELTQAFEEADQVLISEIYPAREKTNPSGITGGQVVEAVKKAYPDKAGTVRLIKGTEDALDILITELKSGDVVVVMAVGNFNRLAYELKDRLK
jgi:UDP-N-acetylmuramate--L-alanine ligase